MASNHQNNKTLFHQTANKIKRFPAFYKLKYSLETLSKDCTRTFLMVIQNPCYIYVAHKCLFSLHNIMWKREVCTGNAALQE